MAKDREFFNRRLHSLLGVLPIGVYLVTHLMVNQFARSGEEAFNKAAGFMGNLPFLYFLEIFVIYLPILFHAIYGVYIAFTAKNNLGRFGHFRNWMFFLQRLTGIITLIFIVWHVWETRIQKFFGAEVNFDMMANILNDPFMFWFYVVGVVSAIFHFANGLWSFCVSWGLTITPRSQRVVTYVTVLIFLGLSYIAISTLFAFVS